MKSDIVAEAYSREGDEAIVEAVEIAPAFVSRKDGGASGYNNAGQQTSCQHQIHLGRLGLLALDVRLRPPYHDRSEFVQTFTDALEHDEAQRNADHGVAHAKRLTGHRHRRRMPITFKRMFLRLFTHISLSERCFIISK